MYEDGGNKDGGEQERRMRQKMEREGGQRKEEHFNKDTYRFGFNIQVSESTSKTVQRNQSEA